MAANYFHNPDVANTAATKTATGSAGNRLQVRAIQWSYDAAAAGGSLVIESPAGTQIFKIFITAAGPGSMQFPVPKLGAQGGDVVVTLAAVAAVKGTVGFDTE